MPQAKLVQLDPARSNRTPLLDGPPETAGLRSGAIVLPPGEAVGKHSTGVREEVIVVLAGSGELRLPEGVTLQLQRHAVAYCPPETEHDVVNTGSERLEYVYVVA